MRNTSHILNKLKSQGCRLTRFRKCILDFLLENHGPLSSADLQAAFSREHIAINKTTVYRELAFLKTEGVVREVQLGDAVRRYELISGDCHHHMVCVNCKRVECVEFEKGLNLQERVVAQCKKFKVLNHSLEIFGLCARCQ